MLYSNDFDAGAPTVAAGITDSLTPGLIQTSVSVSPWWTGKYYANQTFSPTTLRLTGAVPAGPMDLDFTLGFLGSWDSSDGHGPPDYLDILINGTPVLTQLTTNNASGSVQTYGGGTVVGKPVAATTNYIGSDTIVDMATAASLSFNHPGGTLTFQILGYGGGYTPNVTWPNGPNTPPQPVPTAQWDEGWGIDNLVIRTRGSEDVPAPLPLLGAASAYGFSRRLRRRIGQATAKPWSVIR